MKKKDKTKKKKERIKYIDDGSTVADMSAISPRVGGKSAHRGAGKKPRATLKEQFATYIQAVRRMLIPMLVTIGIISVAFGIMWLILYLASL